MAKTKFNWETYYTKATGVKKVNGEWERYEEQIPHYSCELDKAPWAIETDGIGENGSVIISSCEKAYGDGRRDEINFTAWTRDPQQRYILEALRAKFGMKVRNILWLRDFD